MFDIIGVILVLVNLDIKYFGFRWWHTLIVRKRVKSNNIKKFNLILDLQSKIRNSLILKMIPHKFFISSCFNFKFSKPNLFIKKKDKNIFITENKKRNRNRCPNNGSKKCSQSF